jgi:hypothetical protein
MLPKYHIFFGFLLSLFLVILFPNINLIWVGIVFLSSFLIDVDHYFYYVFNRKNANPKKAVNYFFDKRKKANKMNIKERNKFYSGFYFLHGIEILIILAVAGIFVSKYFFLIFIGFAFHLCLDLYEEISLGLRLDKISLIYDWFKFKKLKHLE